MDASKIREHMPVVGADGQRIGTVDRVEGNKIKLTKSGSGDSHHHIIDLADVREVSNGEVHLGKNP